MQEQQHNPLIRIQHKIYVPNAIRYGIRAVVVDINPKYPPITKPCAWLLKITHVFGDVAFLLFLCCHFSARISYRERIRNSILLFVVEMLSLNCVYDSFPHSFISEIRLICLIQLYIVFGTYRFYMQDFF